MKGFKALTIYPFVFVRKDCALRFSAMDERHETTHAIQQLETLWVLFFLIYCLEWLLKLPFCKFNTKKAYYSISFEQEAYNNQTDREYNSMRGFWNWTGYVFTIKE